MVDYNKITIDTYNKTAKEYIENVKDLVPRGELEKFVGRVSHGKILDIGCGSGVGAKNLQENGLQVYGIDLSKELLDASKIESPKSTFYEMDMRNLLFPENNFEGIWYVASLLHLEKKDVPGALDEANRVLKPKGIIYVSVKMGDMEGLEKDKRYGGAEKYYAYYQPEEIESLLKDANFEMLEKPYWITYNDEYRNSHPWMNIFARKK